MTAPLLATVPNVQLARTGTWPASTGTATFTPADFAHAVAALDCPAVRRPVLLLGHTDPGSGTAQYDDHGAPALGYVANMRTSDDGGDLLGDYTGMPAWLAESDGQGNTVLSSAYPDRSIEGEWDHHCALGHTHPFVVSGVAWLGVERPAVGTLQSLIDLYGIVPPTTTGTTVSVNAQEAPMPETVQAAHSVEDVRRAYYGGPGSGWAWWIREVHVDPPQLIVENDDDGAIYRVPFDVTGTAVTFGEPVKVVVEYIDTAVAASHGTSVAAQTGGRLVACSYASKTESRPGQQPAASTTPTGSPTPQEVPVTEPTPSPLAGIATQLGLAETATQEEVNAALAEALAERAEPEQVPTPLPAGVTQIDSAALEQLQRDAAQGVAARAQQEAERRTRLVDAAISDGRIPPARRDGWLGMLSADPGSETVLAGLAKGTVPVSASTTGYDDDGSQITDEALDGWFPQFSTPTATQEA